LSRRFWQAAVQRRAFHRGDPCFLAFDLLTQDGTDCRAERLVDRKRELPRPLKRIPLIATPKYVAPRRRPARKSWAQYNLLNLEPIENLVALLTLKVSRAIFFLVFVSIAVWANDCRELGAGILTDRNDATRIKENARLLDYDAASSCSTRSLICERAVIVPGCEVE